MLGKSATALALTLMAAAVSANPARGQPFAYTILHNFGIQDGNNPFAGVIRDQQGNLYGTTFNGGTLGEGTVFKLDPAGNLTVLYNFNEGTPGAFPYAGVIRDSSGNLYGTNSYGGEYAYGNVYMLGPAGTETVLYAFQGGFDGGNPHAGLIRGKDGTFYGTTTMGGNSNNGVVFKLDPAGKETVLYTFCSEANCADGANPYAGVIRDSAGNLYGTTAAGGVGGSGMVYKVDTSSHETVLHSFTGPPDGAVPYAGLVRDSAGNLYGTTAYGGSGSCLQFGAPNGCGVVFKVEPAGSETVVYSFTGGDDGANPSSSLVLDPAGNLYGTATWGGFNNCASGSFSGCGTVFKVSPAGRLTVLHIFDGFDGGNPYAGLFRDRAGNLFGTTYSGGYTGSGVVFKIVP
jgi:uncharacterized repeat protein (TIGR03803 family)